MPIAAVAIPAAISIIGGIAAHKSASNANKQAQPLLDAQTQLAQQQAAIGKLAGPALQESSDYYRQLLHGDRAAMTTALQPEIRGITELARGAERGLDRGPAGPQRDVAKAELGRQKVGQIGSLFPQARAAGAQGLAQLAGGMNQSAGNAANIYQNLMNGVRRDREQSDSNSAALGEGLGPLLVDFYKAWQNRGAGTAGIGAAGSAGAFNAGLFGSPPASSGFGGAFKGIKFK